MTVAQGLADSFAETLPTILLAGTALAALTACFLYAFQRHNSRAKFFVWFSVLLTIAALLPFGIRRESAGSFAVSATHAHALTLPAHWAFYMFLIWAACALLGVLRVFIGVWQVHKLRRTCAPIDLPAPETNHALNGFQNVRRVSLCVSDRINVPTAIGFFSPAVVFPTWLLNELSAEETNHIVLHELAHLRRWDDWTNLAQKLLRALLFFHPVVWWIDSRLSAERENACDDEVVSATRNPRAYAQCLASLAEKSFTRRSMALAQAAISRLRQTSSRVSRLLSITNPPATGVYKPLVGLVATLSVVCVIAASHLPSLVVFERPAPFAANAVQTPNVQPSIEQVSSNATVPFTKKSTIQHRSRPSLVAPASTEAASLASAEMPERPAVAEPHLTESPVHVAQARATEANNKGVSHPGSVVAQTAFVVVVQETQDGYSDLAVWHLTVWHVPAHTDNSHAPKPIAHRSI